MGSFLISGAASVPEAADYIGEPQLTQIWEYAEGGVLFTDSALTDAACAALYAGFVPSGNTSYVPPLPAAVEDARQTLKTFYDANPATITAAQAATLHRAEVVIIRWMNRRLET